LRRGTRRDAEEQRDAELKIRFFLCVSLRSSAILCVPLPLFG